VFDFHFIVSYPVRKWSCNLRTNTSDHGQGKVGHEQMFCNKGKEFPVNNVAGHSLAAHPMFNTQTSPSNDFFESPHNKAITHCIAHFTIINTTSILPFLTTLTTVFIQTMPEMQRDKNL
jgi:hypothetical protein